VLTFLGGAEVDVPQFKRAGVRLPLRYLPHIVP